MLRMALPKGRLLEGVSRLFGSTGIELCYQNDRDYHPVVKARSEQESAWIKKTGLTATLRKVRAIPQLLALGKYHIGFAGLDLLMESGYEQIVPLYDLGLNRVRLVVAVSKDRLDILSDPPKRPLVIATEYENIASRWAFDRGLAHIIIQTWGSTEAYAPEDADIVFDNTETGRTIEANGLVIIDTIMESTTWLVASRAAIQDEEIKAQIEQLIDMFRKAQEANHG